MNRSKDSKAEIAGSGKAESGLLNPVALVRLQRQVEKLTAETEVGCYCIPFRDLLPPLARINDLLDLVSEVLRGNPRAAARLRSHLSLSDTLVASERGLALLTEIRARGPGYEQPARPNHALWPRERFVPVLAAVVYAARNASELISLVGAIELNLDGLAELSALYDLTLDAPDPGSFAALYRVVLDAARRREQGNRCVAPDSASRVPIHGHQTHLHGGAVLNDPGVLRDWRISRSRLPEALLDCLRDVTWSLQLSGYGVEGDDYVIDSIDPLNACPLSPVRLSGNGFLGVESVEFTGADGRAVAAEPVPGTVTDTSLEVRLPVAAAQGPVWLFIPERVAIGCGLSSIMARPGQPSDYAPGGARVIAFGTMDGKTCTSDPTTEIFWQVEPADARVVVWAEFEGTTEILFNDVALSGMHEVDTSTPGRWDFTIEVISPHGCGIVRSTFWLEVKIDAPPMSILGVEFTQGIQRYKVPPVSGDPDPSNNSVPLIAGMDTMLRVYVYQRSGLGPRATVSGRVLIDGRRFVPYNNGPAGVAMVTDVPRRREVDGSLNFLIPAAACRGRVTAEVEIFTVDTCEIAAASTTVELAWAEHTPFPVTVREIVGPGPSETVPNALQVVLDAFKKLPSPPTAVRQRRGPFIIHGGTTESNYCHDGGYYQLALSVAYEHNGVEGGSHVSSWIGIYAQTGCAADGMMSWPYTSTCISEANALTAAHEIAHTIGMGHTKTGLEACENIAQPVACHFPPPSFQRMNEVAFDIPGNRVINRPWDLQSYRGGDDRFLHPDHWEMTRGMMDGRF